MKNLTLILISIVTAAMTSSAMADSVTIPNVFTSGTPAVAAEVNANFDAVANIININDTAMGVHSADTNAHHSRYIDDEARAAMGANDVTNALNHDRYTDADAVTAVTNTNTFQAVYLQTIIVSPVGTTLENGTHLVNSLAGITDATVDKPYLLKIEPGVYDVGQNYLVLKSYVDVEGSGVEVTRITSNQITSTQATVVLASYSTLRKLTVDNLTASTAFGLRASNITQGKVEDVKVNVVTASRARGITITSSVIEFSNVHISASTNNSDIDCDAMAIFNSSGQIRNSSSLCSGGLRTTGLYFYNSHIDVRNVHARAESGQVNYGLLTMSSDLGAYRVRIYNSQLKGADNSVRATGDFNVYIGASQLKGGNAYVEIGTLTCIGVFDENFANASGYNSCI